MSDEVFQQKLVTVEGASYSLLYAPTRLYHFSSKRYNRRLALSAEVIRVPISEDVLLGDLTTKVELLSYAAHHNIEVPSGLSNPKQIKKLLQSTI